MGVTQCCHHVAISGNNNLKTPASGRRQWQPTPVFLPGESQGRGSLVGCRLWGCIESDTTDAGNFKLTRTVELEMTPALKDWPEVGHQITIRNRAGFPEANLKG